MRESARRAPLGSCPLAFLPEEGTDRAELKGALASLPPLPLGNPGTRLESRSRNRTRIPARSLVACRLPGARDRRGVRRLWYAARHLDVPDRALAYYVNPDPQAASARSSIITWIEQCPPGRGIHGTVPLEMGLRLIAWGYALRPLAGAPALGGRAAHRARDRCAGRAHSRLSLPLLVGQQSPHRPGRGLLHAGFAFSGRPWAARWREVGASILWEEIERQTTPDGVSRELAPLPGACPRASRFLAWLVLRETAASRRRRRTRLAAMLDFVAELDRFPGGGTDRDSDGQSTLPFQGLLHPGLRFSP